MGINMGTGFVQTFVSRGAVMFSDFAVRKSSLVVALMREMNQ